MLEIFSQNQTINTNELLPFSAVALVKGSTAVLSGVNTIQLNQKGVYSVTINISGLPATNGDVSIEMYKDGVLQPQTIIDIPGAITTTGINASKTTLVQVSRNNNPCDCCSSPTTIQFLNLGVGLTGSYSNVVVTKLC